MDGGREATEREGEGGRERSAATTAGPRRSCSEQSRLECSFYLSTLLQEVRERVRRRGQKAVGGWQIKSRNEGRGSSLSASDLMYWNISCRSVQGLRLLVLLYYTLCTHPRFLRCSLSSPFSSAEVTPLHLRPSSRVTPPSLQYTQPLCINTNSSAPLCPVSTEYPASQHAYARG